MNGEHRPARLSLANDCAIATGLALLAALPYLAGGLSPTFINFDDPEYVTANPQVLQGLTLAGARWALTSLQFASWHPLTWLSHMLDVTLFGLDARGHHATNILLHALNAGLLFLALRRMTGAVARSAFVAALFGVHPLRVESVAWVAGRKDVLSGLLFMLVLLAWERYARRGGVGRYLTALGLFALGLTAKSMLVTVPLVLLLLDVWPLRRVSVAGGEGGGAGWKAILLEKIPFLALAVASSATAVMTMRMGGGLVDIGTVSLGERLANAIISYAAYLWATLWPVRLAVYYPFPASAIDWPVIVAAVLLLALLSYGAFRRRFAQPYLAVGWCWFVGMLLPVIGIVHVGSHARADRFTYLPLIGLFLGATWLAAEGLPPALRRARVLVPLAAGVVAACLAASIVQAGYWRDSEILFRRALEITTDNPLIQSHLAIVLGERGRREEGIPYLREAVRVSPDFADARYNLGLSLALTGKHEEAVVHYREAIKIKPDLAIIRHNFAASLASLGRHEEAVAQYREAVRLRPDHANTQYGLGFSLAALGRYEEAAASFREVLRIHPDDARAQTALSRLAARLGSP